MKVGGGRSPSYHRPPRACCFFLNYFLLVAFPLSCSEQYRLN